MLSPSVLATELLGIGQDSKLSLFAAAAYEFLIFNEELLA